MKRVSKEVYEEIVTAKEWVADLFENHRDLVPSVEDVYAFVKHILNPGYLNIHEQLAVLTVLSTGSVCGPFSAQFMMPPTSKCCAEYARVKKELRHAFASVVVYDGNNDVTAVARVSKLGKVTLEVYPYFCKRHTKHKKAYLHKQDFGWLTSSMRLR